MTGVSWVPEACDLPTAERPVRVAEFHDLFGRALRDLTRPAPRLLRLVLDGSAETQLRDLTDRESACCSFFDFTIARTDSGGLTLDVAVPIGHEQVLDGLAVQATAARTASAQATAGRAAGTPAADATAGTPTADATAGPSPRADPNARADPSPWADPNATADPRPSADPDARADPNASADPDATADPRPPAGGRGAGQP